jgi:hypothetical protein
MFSIAYTLSRHRLCSILFHKNLVRRGLSHSPEQPWNNAAATGISRSAQSKILGSSVFPLETSALPNRERKHDEETDFERVEHTEAAEKPSSYSTRPGMDWRIRNRWPAC